MFYLLSNMPSKCNTGLKGRKANQLGGDLILGPTNVQGPIHDAWINGWLHQQSQ